MSRRRFVAVAMGLLVTARSQGDINGRWLLETVAVPVDGETVVYNGTDAYTQPWIKLTPSVDGNTGCNTFNQGG